MYIEFLTENNMTLCYKRLNKVPEIGEIYTFFYYKNKYQKFKYEVINVEYSILDPLSTYPISEIGGAFVTLRPIVEISNTTT